MTTALLLSSDINESDYICFKIAIDINNTKGN